MKIIKSYLLIFIAILLGIITGFLHFEFILKTAETIAALFMNFLKFIASPIVFLAIFSTLLGMPSFGEMKTLGRKIFTYTILTTVIAATIALILYIIINPSNNQILSSFDWDHSQIEQNSYISFFLNIVPSNVIKAFLENNVIGIAFISFFLGIAALKIPEENRLVLSNFFSSFFKLILKATEFIVLLMPLGIWAFITLLVSEARQNSNEFKNIILYLSVILGANFLQGLVVIPLLLKSKGISPLKTAKGSIRALILAFFSKSSNATLPVTLHCAEKHLNIKPRLANFSLPLCTVINMNGCAAFILTTVIFVSQMNGVLFNIWDYCLWIILSTIAAIGNAGVPMGCFFLSSTFLVAMGVPLKIMGIILPFYTFLDMVETTLNVWSDIAVTAIIDKKLK
ncbi:MAG: dicarboxylate/amino acid:cation symporter [Parachlamydiales bacterium]|jgi:Na+/H+-dicarboxylate symporter